MSDLALKLQGFEGPLDLLMHLIEKDKIDIYDIPIVAITDQYIAYLKNLSEFDMEIASHFLVMAATLLQIKSRMLLPKEQTQAEEEEGDPRQQLVEMLLEYRKIKDAAQKLQTMKEEAAKSFARQYMFKDLKLKVLPQYYPIELLKALASMVTAQNIQTAIIEPQAFSVEEKMADILNYLEQKKEGFLLSELFTTGQPGEKVASFLGVLELLKIGSITINQAENFAPIYIFRKQEEL